MALEVQKNLQQSQPLQEIHATCCSVYDDDRSGHDNTTFPSLASLHLTIPITYDLLHPNHPLHSHIELEEPSPLPLGWQKFLNLKTGEIYYTKGGQEVSFIDSKMSGRNGNRVKLDLKLNLSPPRANPLAESPGRSETVSPTSPPTSCVSSELLYQDDNNNNNSRRYSSSPETTSMMLVGCPRCLMYVMLSEEDPRCPKCKSTVLLDVVHDNNTTTTKKTRKN